ncbi:surface-anchored protein [Micrococcales bacterium KH10]|nr:surface-anchored protein [Micrococcales bacterium KH10]
MSARRLHRPIALLTVLAVSLSLLVVASAFTLAHAAEAVRDFALTKGHIDLFEVTYDEESEGLQLLVKDDTKLYDPGVVFRDPAEVSVVVDAAGSATDLSGAPPQYDFLKVDGNTLYLLPQVQDDDLPWPGWSTERLVTSLPSGVTLPGGPTDEPVQLAIEIDGPGHVFTWQSGSFGSLINRYIDTNDPAPDVIPVARHAHVHTNWAFTKPGDYLFTVTPTATTTDGETLTGDSAIYHWHIGDASNLTAPESTEAPSLTGDAHVGGTVTATPGTWTPEAEEYRYQWLRNGQPIPGETSDSYQPTQDEYAQQIAVRVTAITSGRHAGVATSEPEYIADQNGELFAITGIQGSYQPGDILNAQVVGHDLEEGQTYRWIARVPGTTLTFLFNGTGGQHAQGFLTQLIDASHDGIEISAQLRQGSTTVANTPWVPLNVTQEGTAPVLTRTLGEGPLYPGDRYRLEASDLNLGEGEEFRFVFRYAVAWMPTVNVVGTTVSFPTDTTVEVSRTGTNIVPVEVAAQVVRDGLAVRQSAPFLVAPANFELPIEGLQTLYLEGTSANLSAQIYPVRDSDAFIYQWQFSKTANFSAADPSTEIWGEGTTAAISKVLNVAEHDQGYLRLRVLTPDSEQAFVTGAVRVYVTDDPNAQLFLLNGLAAHYHQGDAVNLVLTVSPEPQAGDEIVWEWKWPGTDWDLFPGASGTGYSITAEQALDGVEVRATLDFAADGKESVIADPVTIHVDDHGAAARQKPTVTGETSVTAGDTVTLTRELPANGATVLTEHRWERKAADAENWTVVGNETEAELSFTAAAADDGAQYRVSLIKPNGDLGYGPSPIVILEVQPDPSDGGLVPPGPKLPAPTPTPPAGPVDPDGSNVNTGTKKTKAKVKVALAKKKVKRGKLAVIKVRVRASGAAVRGKVRVKIAGKTRTVKLNKKGRATIRIKVGKKLKLGKRKVAVTYLGSARATKAKKTATIRIRR